MFLLLQLLILATNTGEMKACPGLLGKIKNTSVRCSGQMLVIGKGRERALASVPTFGDPSIRPETRVQSVNVKLERYCGK